MTDQSNEPIVSGASPGLRGQPADPSSSSGPPRVNRVSISTLLDRIERQVSAAVRRDLEHAMVAITDTRNTMESVAGAVHRLDERIARIEGLLGTAVSTEGPSGGALAVAETGLVAAHLAQLERRLVEVDDRASEEILDAIVAVAKHLEAVQTATAWAIVREMRTG